MSKLVPYDPLRPQQFAAHGRGAYNAGKTAVIQEIVDRARRDRGTPPVPVQDK